MFSKISFCSKSPGAFPSQYFVGILCKKLLNARFKKRYFFYDNSSSKSYSFNVFSKQINDNPQGKAMSTSRGFLETFGAQIYVQISTSENFMQRYHYQNHNDSIKRFFRYETYNYFMIFVNFWINLSFITTIQLIQSQCKFVNLLNDEIFNKS